MAGGRPTNYTPELGAKICALVATTPTSLKKICDSREDLPADSSVYLWLATYDEFSRKYYEAKEMQAHCYSDRVMDALWDMDERPEAISKMAQVLKGAQWHLAKLAPKTHGDKSEQKITATVAVHEDRLKELE